MRATGFALLAAVALVGCGSAGRAGATGGTIGVSSPAFAAGGAIPARYTCDGANVSPPLAWTRIPQQAVEVAVTVEDVDAPNGSFVHWATSGIGARVNGLAVGQGGVEGRNDFGRLGYGGPCPPHASKPHRYHFVVYALRSPLGLAPGFRLSGVGTRLARDTLAVGELTGTYRR